MIQRIQTVWMLLASLLAFLTIKFPFYSGSLATDITNSYHPITGTDNLFLLILASALGTCLLINIFLFKQRTIQFRIVIGAILLEGLIIYLYIRETQQYSQGEFSIWAALHPFILLFLFLAAKGIYQDSKLIKESNRLR